MLNILEKEYFGYKQDTLCADDCSKKQQLNVCKNNFNNIRHNIYFWNIDKIKNKLIKEKKIDGYHLKSCDLLSFGKSYIIFIENSLESAHSINAKRDSTIKILQILDENFDISIFKYERIIKIIPKISKPKNIPSLSKFKIMVNNINDKEDMDKYLLGNTIISRIFCDKFNLIFDKIQKLQKEELSTPSP